jgi:hypothetical protein
VAQEHGGGEEHGGGVGDVLAGDVLLINTGPQAEV